MGKPLSKAIALAAVVAIAFIAPATAAPMFVSGAPTAQSDVIRVSDSAKIIHRGRLENDGGAWKKRRHYRERRHEKRHDVRDFDGRSRLYRPKETPKYAYDEYGNYRVYDGDGWDGDWDRRDRRDWDKKRRKRPHIIKMNSFGYQEPSPELKDVLTAVPD
jgi:hypothetical protein